MAILFCLITALFYLCYEQRYVTRQLGRFVLLVANAAVAFAFFTIATILGAMWAAEAWGGYWS